MTFQFAVLGSGSRGNSSLIRHEGGVGLLIDIGLGPRVMDQRLESVGADWSRITAVVLTHTHGDHVDSATLQMMVRRGIVLYCHEAHRFELEADAGFQELDRLRAGAPLRRPALPGPQRVPGRAHCRCGTTAPRSGSGSSRSPGDRTRAVGVGYLADTGSWSEEMADSLADVDILGVEFNHDVHMQKTSGRSRALIARNLGDRGHLSNKQGGRAGSIRPEAVQSRPGGAPGAASPQRAVQPARAGHPRSARGRRNHRPEGLDPRRPPDACPSEPADRPAPAVRRQRSRGRRGPGPPGDLALRPRPRRCCPVLDLDLDLSLDLS